ncbi:MAG TPA: MerR family transcriptional regulator [Streptosporangiaceae bacterium]|nr:MerR family transcriptional regulator [Streptosporangiaceae bacterium]
MTLSPLDDEHAPLYTVGQVASMLEVRQAFLRRIDEHNVVSPRRSPGGQRRYSRHEIGQVQQVVHMMGEGMSLPAIRRIIELEYELAQITRERDELRALLTEHDRRGGAAASSRPSPGRPPPEGEARRG